MHGEHEKLTGRSDPDWPECCASYMVGRQAGRNCLLEPDGTSPASPWLLLIAPSPLVATVTEVDWFARADV